MWNDMEKRFLTANSAAHLLVDAVCASAVVSAAAADLLTVFILYNTFAFSTQCVLGLLTDRYGHCRILAPAACFWVALCGALPLQATWIAVMIGLGNSLFHVSAGSTVMEISDGRAAPLGFFVAPGALGVFAGKVFPWFRTVFCILLTLTALWLLAEYRLERKQPVSVPDEEEPTREYLGMALLLLLAVMTRAIGGSVAVISRQLMTWQNALLIFTVFAGKSLGGIISDRIGIRKMTGISLPIAAILILITGRSFTAGTVGQFLLNLSMPVTLFLIYRCLPKAPGFSFGLAASALWPGTLIGNYISVSEKIRTALLLFCFGISLVSILYSERKISHEKSN